jgi:hypothetical protein
LRLLSAFGSPTTGRLLSIDARDLEFHSLQFSRDPQCAVCAGPAA